MERVALDDTELLHGGGEVELLAGFAQVAVGMCSGGAEEVVV